MAQSQRSYVEKTFAPDIRPKAREVFFPGPNRSFSVAYLGAVVGLRRVVRLVLGGHETLVDDWGAFDRPATVYTHYELHDNMDARARRFANRWGSGVSPLPVGSRWQSARQLMDGDKPVGFSEGGVTARHVPLFVEAADMLHTHPHIKGPHDFTVYIDTDSMAGQPLDRFSLIGIGQGQGTAAEPDWLAFEQLATYAIEAYEAVYATGEPEAASLAATEAMRRAF